MVVAMPPSVEGDAPPYAPAVIETISHEDFETASIRSAAPSYSEYSPLLASVTHVVNDYAHCHV